MICTSAKALLIQIGGGDVDVYALGVQPYNLHLKFSLEAQILFESEELTTNSHYFDD